MMFPEGSMLILQNKTKFIALTDEHQLSNLIHQLGLIKFEKKKLINLKISRLRCSWKGNYIPDVGHTCYK